jgi:hypothetical protein
MSLDRRATNPDQRVDIIDRLLKLWDTHPQLRLGQLIANATSTITNPQLYYIEDHNLIDKLEEYYQVADEDEGQRITGAINADPDEVARLRKARRDAREGRHYPRDKS